MKKGLISCFHHLMAVPPALPTAYTRDDFANFMRQETLLFCRRYARQRVVIHGGHHLVEATQRQSALLGCLHYGSFFLSGGAIIHQLGIPYTAVVTSRNFGGLPTEEADFWRGVHQRTTAMYGRPLVPTGTKPHAILEWLGTPGRLLGVVLDVREQGQKAKEYPFVFQGHPIFMQAGPARLAHLAGVPLVPMSIQYNPAERCHHLYFDAPIMPDGDPVAMTEMALKVLEKYVSQDPRQLFHDIVGEFAFPCSAA